jgi:dipeptidyl aminopeptidase/acylaminoacyl peptidase
MLLVGDGLWAADLDGSGLTQLTGESLLNPLNLVQVAPKGGHLAYITGTPTDPPQGATLRIATLSTGEMRTVTALTTGLAEPIAPAWGGPAYEAATAATSFDSLSWSPDGRRLAFVGALDGPSADLYVYSLDEGTIRRLTSGPTQAAHPVWSGNGKFIVHEGVSSVGLGSPRRVETFWVVRADGEEVRALDIPPGERLSVAGCIGDHSVLLYGGPGLDITNLRAADIDTGEVQTLWDGPWIRQFVLDSASGHILLISPDECGPGHDCLWHMSADGTAPEIVLEEAEFDYLQKIDSGAVALTNGQLLTFSPEGVVIDSIQLPADIHESYPIPAPAGPLWAWRNILKDRSGLWISSGAHDGSPLLVFAGPVASLAWAPDGQSLMFRGESGGQPGLYVARSPAFEPTLVGNEASGHVLPVPP